MIIQNPSVPNGTYLFAPEFPMFNDVLTPHCYITMRKGRGFMHVLNGTTNWTAIPRMRKFGTITSADYTDQQLDDALIEEATDFEMKSSLLTSNEVADKVPSNSTENPEVITAEQWKKFVFGDKLSLEQQKNLKEIIQKHR